jgi:hypothetical protein
MHPDAPVAFFRIPHAGARPPLPDRWEYFQEIQGYLAENYEVAHKLPKNVNVLVRRTNGNRKYHDQKHATQQANANSN